MDKTSHETHFKEEVPVSERSELFIGLVGATGVDLNNIFEDIKKRLKAFDYDTYQIKISDFFYDPYFKDKYQIDIGEKDRDNTDIFKEKYRKIEEGQEPKKSMLKSKEFQNVYLKMEAGNQIRKDSKSFSVLARHCIQAIQNIREERIEDKNKKKGVAYIFQSLKNPEESELLSEVYSSGYYQIGVYATEAERIKQLTNINPDDAKKLIKKDMNEENKEYGQKTRKTFQLSDFFIKQDLRPIKEQTAEKQTTEEQLKRIFNLIFGHPYTTPTKDEHAMYMAYAYSTRSADLSRQVGAVICNERGDIIGLGSNDVPCFGGGPYWPDPHNENKEDWRDYRYIQEEWQDDEENNKDEKGKKGQDANQINKDQIIEEILKIFESDGKNTKTIKNLKEKLLKKTGINYIKEFGRPTHAEMSVILSCARNGVSPRGGTIYCTTFPCHNCTRHIIDVGIKKVVFVEPYPSSKARLLHSDSIAVEPINGQKNSHKLRFEHFIGVAARRYLDLFSLKLGMGLPIKRKDEYGKTIDFESKRKNAKPRVPSITYYLDREKEVLLKL